MIFWCAVVLLTILLQNPVQGIYGDEECPESKATVEVVHTCPETESEWRKREIMKNCSFITHTCSNGLHYHCLINPWQNMTVEVCAPRTEINSGYCAEYNTGGGRVQDFHEASCPSCGENYFSTKAYLHPVCYKAVYSRFNIISRQSTSSGTTTTQLQNLHLFQKSVYLFVMYVSVRRIIIVL